MIEFIKPAWKAFDHVPFDGSDDGSTALPQFVYEPEGVSAPTRMLFTNPTDNPIGAPLNPVTTKSTPNSLAFRRTFSV